MTRPASTVTGQGGPTVLLLHGIGGGRSIWADAAAGTATVLAQAGFRAVAIDLPGYGDTPGTPRMDEMVRAVLALADPPAAPSAAPVMVVGHSMGGMVAQELAARAPGRVRGLVLACTSASFGDVARDWQAQFIAERLAPLDAGLGMAAMADRLVPGLVSPQASAAARRLARDIMASVPEATYRAALHAIVGFDRRAALAQIAVPTLLLAAEHDRTAPPEVMKRMAARITGSEYLCLAGVGHIAPVEAPQAFNAAVVAFLLRHFGTD